MDVVVVGGFVPTAVGAACHVSANRELSAVDRDYRHEIKRHNRGIVYLALVFVHSRMFQTNQRFLTRRRRHCNWIEDFRAGTNSSG